jgi:hypothetical protein
MYMHAIESGKFSGKQLAARSCQPRELAWGYRLGGYERLPA